MRNTFIENLVSNAYRDDSIVLIVGDLGFNVVEDFQKNFPTRFFNAGICEQSMASMAAGLASEGYKVFIYSIANFPTFRCAEQIRNDICYHNLDVSIVTVGGGLAYGNLGYSHHAIQDYGLMRLFPEMTIISPGDPNEVEKVFDFIQNDKFPKYIRLRKNGEPNFSSNELNKPGIWNNITGGTKKNIFLSTGYGLKIAFDIMAAENLFNDFDVYSCPIWGSKFSNLQQSQLEKFNEIITIEDHLKSGGFGSWIKENFNELENKTKIKSFYIKDSIIGKVGDENFLLKNIHRGIYSK